MKHSMTIAIFCLGSNIELRDIISLTTISLPHRIPPWSHYLLKIYLLSTYYDRHPGYNNHDWEEFLFLFSEWKKKDQKAK